MFLSYFRAALRLFPGCCFDYIMIFAKRKECFFVILHLCTISTKQCWFIRVFIAQKRHLYSKTQQKSRANRSPFRVDSSCLLMLFSADLCQVFFDYNQCNLTPKVWECRTEGFQRAIADFVCSHCPLVAPAGAKSPARKLTSARKPPYSNKYPSITFKVLSAPSRWLRSYPCDAYTPAPISPWRMSYPARKVASTSDP